MNPKSTQTKKESISRRIKLTVTYDGTHFHGWAHQHNLRTVQGTINDALKKIIDDEVELFGASRTDAGAHAMGQVCHFDTASTIPPTKWATILNNCLDHDLKILNSEEVSHNFHSRFSAQHRTYCYKILTSLDPLRSRYAYYAPENDTLSLNRMKKAAEMIVGTHNFLAFSKDILPSQNTIRHLFKVDVHQEKDEISITITGTAFLKGMMRKISGALVEIGLCKRTLREFMRHLDGHLDLPLPRMLPAHGLTLIKVYYGRYPKDIRNLYFSSDEPEHSKLEMNYNVWRSHE